MDNFGHLKFVDNSRFFLLFAAVCAAAFAVAAPARVVKDIPYNPETGEAGLGDLYLPDDVRPETPLILVIHGGGWSAMSRAGVAGIAEFFQCDLGFAAFNIEYRLASAKNPWPACGDDCVTAAKFVLSDAFRAKYGLRHKKIWITGGSAGGHLVLWTLVNLPLDSVAGAISISAISDPTPDFRMHRGRYVPLFGKGVTEEMLGAMNPIPLIRKGMAPLLCTHADTDAVVPIASHRAFADAYCAAGNRCDFYEYRHDEEPNEGGHFIWRPKSKPHKLLACLEARMEKFVREFEKAPPPPQPELLFAADFDGTAKAGVAGGNPDPISKSRNLKFVPGLRGQALEMTKGMNAALGYKTDGNLNLLRGAISFWFKPADGVTPGGEERRFYLCTAAASPRAGSGTLWFWKYGPRLRADQSDDGDSYTLLLRPYLTNEWNHVVFTWDEKKGTSIYLNGRKGTRRMSDSSMSGMMKAAAKAPRGGRPGALSFSRRRTFDTFFVGGYGGSAFMDGAMDELRIYSAPLDDDAVKRLFIEGGGSEPEPPPPPDYRAKYANDPPNPFEAQPLAKSGVPGELELMEQVVFDHVPADSNRFVSAGACRIGNLGGTPYLEADEAVHGRFAYRFALDESTPLYVFEIDYPDDRKRTMDLIVQGCGQTAWDGATGASYALQQGVACGDEYPNSGRILTHRCLYWMGEGGRNKLRPSRSECDDGGRNKLRPSREGRAPARPHVDVALAAMTARGGAPAAIAAIRLYKVKNGRLPVAAIHEPAANADGWRRTFALYFEDPAIGYDFGIDGTNEERVGPMIDRIAATMKYTGQNLLAYPGSWYAGLMDGEYNPRVHAPAYRTAYYAKFDREGLGFMPTINQNDIILPPGSITRDKIEDGSLLASPFSIFDDGRPNPGGWHGTPPNFNIAHPDVQQALEREVDTFIAEGSAHPSFKGVVLHLTRHSLTWFGDERAGYNDYAVEAFARAKGLTIPVDRKDPMRGKTYADWIRANAYEAWLDWRCGVVADIYRRLAAKLRAARSDLKLMVNTFLLPDWRHPDFGKENFIPEANRRAGLDVRMLADVPNLIVCQTEIPADYRWFGPMNPFNPKDNGRWREFRTTAEPAHRNLYFKRGDYALLDGAAFPWVNQHDRYWESAIGRTTKGQPGKTLSCAWLKECPWRVTTINPSGRHALKHYAVPFRYHDVLGLSKGGFLIGTYGTEDVLVPFIQAFRALPAVVFDDVGGSSDSLVKVRQKEFGGKSYFYAINTSEKTASVTLKVPPGTEDLVTKARLAQDGSPQTVTLDLQAYELRSFAAPFGKPTVR